MHFALEVRTPSAVRKPQRWRIVRPRLDASAVGADTRFSLGAQQHRAWGLPDNRSGAPRGAERGAGVGQEPDGYAAPDGTGGDWRCT